MRAAIYVRAATSDHTEFKIKQQLADNRRWLEARGDTLVDTYIDRNIDGLTVNRPALKQLLDDAAERRFDLVIMTQTSILARGPKTFKMLRKRLSSLGMKVASVEEGVLEEAVSGINYELLEQFKAANSRIRPEVEGTF